MHTRNRRVVRPGYLCEGRIPSTGRNKPRRVLDTAYENIEITTRSHPDAFPSALQQKRKTQTKTHHADEVRLKVSGERAVIKAVDMSTFFFFV